MVANSNLDRDSKTKVMEAMGRSSSLFSQTQTKEISMRVIVDMETRAMETAKWEVRLLIFLETRTLENIYPDGSPRTLM